MYRREEKKIGEDKKKSEKSKINKELARVGYPFAFKVNGGECFDFPCTWKSSLWSNVALTERDYVLPLSTEQTASKPCGKII